MKEIRFGIWIDNAEAILVRFGEDDEAEVRHIESGVASRSKSGGGMSGTRGQVGGASHKKAARRRVNQFSRFFDEVWEAVHDADQVAILGPGTAKKGLESRIEEEARRPEVLTIEAEQRRTDPQLVDRFRRIFNIPRRG